MSITPPPPFVVERLVRLALEEDLGRGDVTTESCVAEGTRGAAVVRARAELVLAGLPVARQAWAAIDPTVRFEALAADGDQLVGGAAAARVEGPARALLMGERVALNFLQRLSGIATMTHRFVAVLPDGSRTRITDTRKTTPGLQSLERYAVRCGGAHNHREDLSSAVLIKDNHIAAAGGVHAAIERALSRAPHVSRIECEVDTLEQLRAAIDAGADILLLDNFDDDALDEAVRTAGGRVQLEVSGGVTLDRVARIAGTGVDVISVGALTHSAPAADLGLDWEAAIP